MGNNKQVAIFFESLKICLVQWIEKLFLRKANLYTEFVLSQIRGPLLKEQLEKHNLEELSLTLILVLIDKNWTNLRKRCDLPPAYRHSFLTVNRLQNRLLFSEKEDASISLQEKNALNNVLKSISASQELKNLGQSVFQQRTSSVEDSSLQEETPINASESKDEIECSGIVFLKSDPSKLGAVIKVEGERVTVFLEGKIQVFYAEQVQIVEKEKPKIVPLDLARNRGIAFLLSHPLSSSLYSLRAARIDVIPYQYKPVLKVVQSDQPRILIADGVGLGKTIEAGLVLRELEVRNNVKSVLIICPKPLVTEEKWVQELKRFDEEFDTLDSKRLRYCLDETDKEGEWPEKYNKVILPFSLCDEKLLATLVALDPPPRFDMVIVDEAHHIRNENTRAHQIVERFCDTAEAVIFLTATPLQLGNNDLYSLLHCLRPSDIPDEQTFRDLQSPNIHITKACSYAKAKKYDEALEELQQIQTLPAAQVVQSNEAYEPTIQLLKKGKLDNDELVTLVDNIRELHTFDSFINRTLRKDVASDFCVRHPHTIQISFTDEEKKVYSELLCLRAKILQNIHGVENVRFMMNMLERQASSSIHGLAPFIREMLLGSLMAEDLLSIDGDEEIDLNIKQSLIEKYKNQIENLGQKADLLSDDDPKFDALRTVVLDKQKLNNKKVIVFSTFRNTLAYLLRRLTEEDVRVGVIHGGVSDEDRKLLRERFAKKTEEDDVIDVLLFSEVGCEGLDYQFCDTLINYDLPWNPMKIEQRIGRIDRFGQESEAVAIYNIIVSGTVDSDIYERCLSRINIFETSVGDCDEILGDVYKQIRNVCEDIRLSPEQRQEKLEQIAVNECRRLKMQRELESKQASLFSMPTDLTGVQGLQKYENPWLSENSMEDLVSDYLKNITKAPNPVIFSEGRKKLRLSQEAKAILWTDYKNTQGKRNKNYRDFEKYLQGNEQFEFVTFASEEAAAQTKTQFIMPMHPLSKMASRYFRSESQNLANLQIVDNNLPEGSFSFEVYGWEYLGNGQRLELKCFCDNKLVQENLLQLILVAANNDGNVIPQTEALNDDIKKHWKEEKQKHIEFSQRLAKSRIRSLELSSNARRKTAINQTQGAKRIQENWLRKIDTEQKLKEQEINDQASKADIVFYEIIAGVLTIHHNDKQ